MHQHCELEKNKRLEKCTRLACARWPTANAGRVAAQELRKKVRLHKRQTTAGISTAPIFYQFKLNISVDNGGPAVTGFLSHQKKNATDGLGRLC